MVPAAHPGAMGAVAGPAWCGQAAWMRQSMLVATLAAMNESGAEAVVAGASRLPEGRPYLLTIA